MNNGNKEPLDTPVREMTDEEVHAAALSDPDAQPLTKEDFARMKSTPRAKIIRRALGLTQEEFSSLYRIPLGTLRDWEQGRTEPDRAMYAYLKVIATMPEAVQSALQYTPQSPSIQ
ncbi:MAG TPA: helix-turn-helix domain-containing protein [Ktedonobacteraceae bacterium]|nr:helix-turn-helix domain-containing protein [Ktedonobacteraceae bacterium]